jgi:hypothetical protein
LFKNLLNRAPKEIFSNMTGILIGNEIKNGLLLAQQSAFQDLTVQHWYWVWKRKKRSFPMKGYKYGKKILKNKLRKQVLYIFPA